MSLRLDGKGFSKIIPKLKQAGLLEAGGYSATFADIMQEVATAIMHKFSGVCAFTQSDEVTVREPKHIASKCCYHPHRITETWCFRC